MADPSTQPPAPTPTSDEKKEETATAILRQKKCESAIADNGIVKKIEPSRLISIIFTFFAFRLAPNRLFVEESTTDDNSVACLSAAKMEELGLFRGDTSKSCFDMQWMIVLRC